MLSRIIDALTPRFIAALGEGCRRALHLSTILALFGVVLGAIVFLNNLLFPVLEAGPDFYETSVRASGAIFGLSVAAYLLLMLGRPNLARPLLMLTALTITGAFAYVLGRPAGVDLVGAACLVFLPALIYSETERMQKFAGVAVSVVAILGLQLWLATMPPAFALPPEEVEILRFNVTLVAIMLGFFVAYLHHTAEKAKAALAVEKERADELLRNILPDSVMARLKAGDRLVADRHEEVCVLFADLVGFTRMSAGRPAAEIVTVLNHVFSRFDDLADQHGVEKIKTMGDGYLAVAGLPGCGDDRPPADALADFAIAMRDAALEMGADLDEPFSIRIGLHAGPAISGVIGKRKFAFDLWGATVNLASRMESNSEPGVITISGAYRALLGDAFITPSRGRVTAKGVGEVEVFALERRAGPRAAAA